MPPEPAPQGHADAIRYAQQHADTLRRIISSRLGARLRQVFCTQDIEQSLLRVLLQQPQPAQPLAESELSRLVTVIALRLVRAKARHEHLSQWESASGSLEKETVAYYDPAEEAAARDFLETVKTLAGDDWALVEARLEGRTFPELAASFQSTPDALRMRWKRAIDRITQQMKGEADE